jgi:hypothetical protein
MCGAKQKEKKMLKKKAKLAGLLSALVCAALLAMTGLAQDKAQAVEGAYDITASGDQIGTVKFVMILKRSDGKWGGEIKDAPLPLNVESVAVDGDNNVTINAAAEGSAVTITGKYSEGKLTGKWTTGGSSGDWAGTKQGVTAAAPTTAPAAATAGVVEGAYDAQINTEGQGTLNFTLVVKRDGEKLTTEVKDGDQLNAIGLSVVGITLNGDSVALDMSYQGNPFSLPGKRTGQEMGGKWEAGGYSGTWAAKKRAN